MSDAELFSGSEDGYPLVAYESYVFRGSLCGVTIHFLASPAQLAAGEHSSVNLVLTATMARNLALALVGSAKAVDALSEKDRTH